jgi:hypothetical protein
MLGLLGAWAQLGAFVAHFSKARRSLEKRRNIRAKELP